MTINCDLRCAKRSRDAPCHWKCAVSHCTSSNLHSWAEYL